MHRYFIKTLSSLALLCCCGASNAETLKEIYQQAVNNDHEFKAAEAALRAGEESKNIGRASLLPQINGEINWSQSDGERVGLEDRVNGEPPVILRNQVVSSTSEDTSSGYQISLVQPLFDMSLWHGYQSGKLQSKIALAEFQSDKQALIIRTANAYFDVLRAIDNFETAKAEENANSHQLEQTQKRFEVGLTAITEVHEAQAAYDNSLARRLLEEGNVGISFEALEVITGKSYVSLSPMKEDFPITPPSPSNRQDWVDFAIANNFDLAASSLQAKLSEKSAKQSKSGHYPTLSGQIVVSNSEADGTVGSGGIDLNSDIENDGTSFGLTLSVPIFSGGRVSANRRQAAEQYIQARESYLKTQRDTVQRARSLHLTVLTDVATIKARQQAIVSSTSALEATQAGYEVGTRDLVDVLISQRTLYQAQRDYYNSLYTYILNTLRLKQVAGTLTEKDVLELDGWLDTSKQVSRNTL